MKEKNFKVGDLVSVLDADITGEVEFVANNRISILTEDGFSFEFEKQELVKLENITAFKQDIFKNTSSNTAIKNKEEKKKKLVVKKPKDRYEPTLEVDLHIHHLTNSTNGMTNHDMLTLQLDTAKRQLEFAIKKRMQKIVFIHGVGEGILKLELEYLFGRYSNIKFYDANYQKYGLGATEVYIFQNTKS